MRLFYDKSIHGFLLVGTHHTTESLITQHESTGFHNTENKSIDKCEAMMVSIDYRRGSISKCYCFSNELRISANENGKRKHCEEDKT